MSDNYFFLEMMARERIRDLHAQAKGLSDQELRQYLQTEGLTSQALRQSGIQTSSLLRVLRRIALGLSNLSSRSGKVRVADMDAADLIQKSHPISRELQNKISISRS